MVGARAKSLPRVLRARNSSALRVVCVALAALLCTGFDVATVEDGVVRVFKQGGGKLGVGTGFIVKDRNIVVTNHHVIRGGERIFVGVLHNGRPVSRRARVLYVDKDKDLAILKTESNLPGRALRLSSYEPAKGADVTAIGFPAAADPRFPRKAFRGEFDRAMFDSTVSKGTVSRIRNRLGRWNAQLIQHTTAINPGNSGGPLFDECGNVVGVNSFIRRKLRKNGKVIDVYQGLHYSVHAKEVIAFMRQHGLEPDEPAETCTPKTAKSDMALIYVLFGSTILLLSVATIAIAKRRPSVLMVPLSKMGERTSLLLRRAGHDDKARDHNDRAGTGRESGVEDKIRNHSKGERIRLRPTAGGLPIHLDEDKLADAVNVGRSSESDVRIPHKSVSSRHACIWRDDDGQIRVRDLGSSNGTWTSQGRIKEAALKGGDIVRFGRITFDVETGPGVDEAVAVSRDAKALRLYGVGPNGEALELEMVPDVNVGSARHIETDWHIGREPTVCDLAIDSQKVSGRHARIRYVPDEGWQISDLKSRNGMLVDGRRLKDDSRPLTGVSRLEIAGITLWFQPH